MSKRKHRVPRKTQPPRPPATVADDSLIDVLFLADCRRHGNPATTLYQAQALMGIADRLRRQQAQVKAGSRIQIAAALVNCALVAGKNVGAVAVHFRTDDEPLLLEWADEATNDAEGEGWVVPPAQAPELPY